MVISDFCIIVVQCRTHDSAIRYSNFELKYTSSIFCIIDRNFKHEKFCVLNILHHFLKSEINKQTNIKSCRKVKIKYTVFGLITMTPHGMGFGVN